MAVENTNSVNLVYVIAFILGIIGIGIVLTRIYNIELPFITDDRGAFIALGILAFLMCILVMKYGIENYGWVDPIIIITSIIGILVFLLIGVVFFNISTPLNLDDRSALILLAILVVTKMFLANGQRILDVLGIIY